MKCPTCKDVTLVMTSQQDIEIDYRPECRGVWLDRGELDKLIEKSNTSQNMQSIQNTPSPQYYKKSKDDYKYEHDYKRKKSFLSELFD